MLDCRIASISDIHFGDRHNDTTDIIRNCERMIFTEGLIKRIDILFFAGDIFDRLLDLDHDNVGEIDHFFSRVCREAKHHNVKVRLLRGTFSHDNDQVERFMTIAEIVDCGVDIKYFNKPDIEYIEDFECHVLYIPDHWTPKTEDTLIEVHELLKSRGLEQVDIAIMHGHMDFQVPQGLKKAMVFHDSAAYEKIVRQVIFIGHEHKHSRKGKVFAQGSPDRLGHGQEDPKGMAYCEIVNNVCTVWFVENTNARIYKSVVITGLELDTAIKHVLTTVKGLPANACVRVVGESKHPLFSNMSELSVKFPTYVWSKKGIEEDDEFNPKQTGTLLNDTEEWIPVHIEKSNVVGLIMDRLKAKALTETDLDYIERQLEELK